MKRIIMILAAVLAMAGGSGLKAQSEFASGLIGVGVVCSDIEKSLDFYLNVVGMKKVSEFDVDAEFGQASGLTDGIAFHVDVLKLEDSESANQWKLMSFDKEGPQPTSNFIHDNTGPQYITIMVKDLTPFIRRIKKHNVKLMGDTPVPLGENGHFALIQDPDGTFIELIGPMR